MVLGLVAALLLPEVTDAAEFSLASDGYVVRNGTRIFPLGLFQVPTSKFAAIKHSRFNTAARFSADTESDREFLRALSRLSMYGIVGVDTHQVLERSNESIRSFVRDYVSSLQDGPRPIAYLLPDEHVTLGQPLEKLVAVRDAIKSVDANAVTLYEDYTKEGAVTAKDIYDVLAWDKYPIRSDGESIEEWRSELRDVKAAIHPKPFWLTLQAWVKPPDIREPTKDELRAMAYTAIANGATGLIAWAYDYGPYGTGLRDYPRLWENLNALMAELGSLSDVLALPDSATVITPSVDGIDVKLKQGKGKYYLIATNYKSGARQPDGHYSGVPLSNVTFRISGFKAAAVKSRIDAPATSARALASGAFSESFPAYGVQVYEITPE